MIACSAINVSEFDVYYISISANVSIPVTKGPSRVDVGVPPVVQYSPKLNSYRIMSPCPVIIWEKWTVAHLWELRSEPLL